MLSSREHECAPYDVDNCEMEYVYEEGLIAVPVGERGEDAEQAIIRVHRGRSYRVVTFQIQRSGAWPTIPPPRPMNDNEVLIRSSVKPARPAIGVDNQHHKFSVSGVYVFAHKKPVRPGIDPLPVGTGPEDATEPQLSRVTPEMFDKRPLTSGPAVQSPPLQHGISNP